jgi:signal transduction histidine kinase
MRALPSLLDAVGRRLALRLPDSEPIEVERVLAVARALLAGASLLAVTFAPTGPTRNANLASILLLLYTAHSLAVFVIVGLRTEMSPRVVLLIHAADLLWPALITMFTNGPNSPFVLYFSFALLAAAFRWGMIQALATTLTAVALMGLEAALFKGRLSDWIEPGLNFNTFILSGAFLAIFGVLVGYLAEAEKRGRGQALSIGQVSSKARVEIGLKATLQATLQELLGLFDGRKLLVVVSEGNPPQAYLWRLEVLKRPGDVVFAGQQVDASENPIYLFGTLEECVGAAWRSRNMVSAVVIDKDGARRRDKQCHLSSEFVARHPYHLLLMSSVSVATDVSARLFMFEPRLGGLAETQLRILQDLTSRVAPAVYNVYLLRRLRSRAAAAERGRVARELHDGVVQSLHAIAFRLYALRTGQTIDPTERSQELTEIQQLVQGEAANLRALIRQLKPLDFDPRHLVDFLSRMIDQYRYDTGIGAKFVCDVAEVMLPPRTCRELAGIVQEALANVLKHSGAENVLVRLALQKGTCSLTIEDDGRGFEFSGKISHGQLKHSRRGPLVIKERVRAIGGELSIESNPGQGARLEIIFPRQVESSIA